MINPMLGQVLGGVFGQAMARRGRRGGLGGALGGAAMGTVLGGVFGGRGMSAARRGRGGSRTALMMLLLPLAMRWVQRNGGMGAVLDRFRQKGYGRQMQSWVAPGDNQPIDEQAVATVVGHEELQRMAQRLDVPEQEVAQAFAEVMPEMVNQLTPDGQLPADADDVLADSRQQLELQIEDVRHREPGRS